MEQFVSEFEVFGTVQGVFFRKHTLKKADSLGITGYCKNVNNHNRTVTGEIQGTENQIENMKMWLSKTGSPSSIIERAVFSKLRPSEGKYKKFSIEKD